MEQFSLSSPHQTQPIYVASAERELGRVDESV